MSERATVVLGFDGSAGAAAAVTVAARLFPGARAVVVHGWAPIDEHLSVAPVPGMGAALGGGLAELNRAEGERSEALAAAGAELARAAGLEAEPLCEPVRGPAWKALCSVAERLEADAIVVGSRGRSGMGATLLGSVSHGVLHHARRPVLVVPRVTDAED